MNNIYRVAYKLEQYSQENEIDILAPNKYQALIKAQYEAIPSKEGQHSYAAWVVSVTYQNGNYRKFNTFEGKPL